MSSEGAVKEKQLHPEVVSSVKDIVTDIEEKLDHASHGLAALKALIDAIEAKLDDGTFGLEEIKNEIVIIDNEIAVIDAEVAAIEAKLDARLDVAVSTRAVPGDAMALTPAERLIVQALIINDLTPFAGASIATILADIIIIDGIVDGIVADIGVFPTANYATLAAYVEDVRTRLITLITSVVPKATDEQDNFLWDTSVYLTNETDISALFTTPLTGATRRRYSLFLDLTGPAGDAAAWTKCTLKVKVEIDGANPRTVDKKEIAKTDVAAAEEPGINIDIPALAKDCQVTMQFDVALAGDVTIYYHYVTEVLE